MLKNLILIILFIASLLLSANQVQAASIEASGGIDLGASIGYTKAGGFGVYYKLGGRFPSSDIGIEVMAGGFEATTSNTFTFGDGTSNTVTDDNSYRYYHYAINKTIYKFEDQEVNAGIGYAVSRVHISKDELLMVEVEMIREREDGMTYNYEIRWPMAMNFGIGKSFNI